MPKYKAPATAPSAASTGVATAERSASHRAMAHRVTIPSPSNSQWIVHRPPGWLGLASGSYPW